MMQFDVKREDLLRPLQMVSHVPEKRQTLPILSHLLLKIEAGQVSIRGTDLEIMIESYAPLLGDNFSEKEVTLSGRKLLDICRNLPQDASLKFLEEENNRCLIHSGVSQFSLATLPASNFPGFDEENQDYLEIVVKVKDLLKLIQSTAFAIAQKDFRHYLNGMLVEVSGDQLIFVATDGHRLALNQMTLPAEVKEKLSIIMPRKGVVELMRLLSSQDGDADIKLMINANHMMAKTADFKFISRLIEGPFPNYEQVIPKKGNKSFQIDNQVLKQALIRTSILSNERLPGVSMQLKNNILHLWAKNAEKEEAREEVSVDYPHEDMSVSFNATYLIDVLNVVSGAVKLTFLNSSSAFLVEGAVEGQGWVSLFVIMPMRL